LKIAIVDDEALAIQRLKRMLESFGDISEFTEPNEVLKECFDVAFLDISMSELNGVELAKKIRDKYPETFIVFQTAYEEFALEAFKTGAIDYLVKPFSSEELNKTLKKIKSYQKSRVNKIVASSFDETFIVGLDEIYYIKAYLDEVIIKTRERELFAKKRIKDLESIADNFFRIHRSYIVNIDKIESMQTVENSKLKIKLSDIDEYITSSKDGAKEFREYLNRTTL
jgi:two-component system LytT family response regulator